MASQTPGSYAASLFIHGGVVALMFGVGWFMQTQQREPVKVFDVVAGAGDNWAATEAPALGSETGSEGIKMPNVPTPMPRIDDPSPPSSNEPVAPQPASEPEPDPIKPAPLPKPKPTPTAAKVADTPSPLDTKKTTLTQDFKRLQEKRYNRKIEQFRKQQAAAEAKAKKDAEAAKKKAEDDAKRQNSGKAGGGTFAKIDAKGIAGGVVGGSTRNTKGGAGGTAMSAEEASLMERYFAFLKRQLKTAHIPPPGAGDMLSTSIEFYCSADGILSRVKVVTSSGNDEFDQSVVEAFKRVRSIGARPDGKSELHEVEFKARED